MPRFLHLEAKPQTPCMPCKHPSNCTVPLNAPTPFYFLHFSFLANLQAHLMQMHAFSFLSAPSSLAVSILLFPGSMSPVDCGLYI